MEHALIEFFFASGCRVAEIQRLNRNDIDWQRGAVNVLGKGNKEREVYFGAKFRIWLQRYLHERSDDDRALFVTVRRPHRMSIHEIQYIFKRIAGRCNLEDRVSPHRMRHTLATILTKVRRWSRYNQSLDTRSQRRLSCTLRSVVPHGNRHISDTLFNKGFWIAFVAGPGVGRR